MPEMLPNHKTNEPTGGRLTHKTQKFACLCEKERCMGTLEMLPSRKTNEHTRHKSLNAFVKRRGAWACHKHSLVTRQTNTQEEARRLKETSLDYKARASFIK